MESPSASDRGTLNIGTSVYSKSHVARQILYGVSLQDWEFHNGSLTFDENGELHLSGRSGIDRDLADELSSIRGQGRIVPIFSHFSADEGDGVDEDRSQDSHEEGVYTIVEWAGVRIVDVVIKGRHGNIVAQAGEVTTAGTVAAETTKRKSRFISSRIWLAQ